MRKSALIVVAVVLSTMTPSSQGRSVIVVKPFTSSPGVELPYDLKLMQTQLVAELRVMLGKQFEFVAEAPAAADGSFYALEGEITGWRPGNAAQRIVVGLGSGREASDVQYRLTDSSGKKVLDRQDTVRTNFYSQGAGSTGTIAQKIADRIKDSKLK